MRAVNVLKVIAVAAISSMVMFLTSCEKDLPQVIDSEVYNQEKPGDATLTTTENGATLSYVSSISVRGVTKGSFDEKVSIELQGNANNVEMAYDVSKWKLEEYEPYQTHKVSDVTRTEGFVSVVDSMIVYTVPFEQFEFSYYLVFEVATYDDGVTRQVMPYHYFKIIRDNGGYFEDADSYEEYGKAYARKIYRHSITVEFGGQTFEVPAEITLRRYLGPASEPYALRCEVLENSVSSKPSKDGFTSLLRVKSFMSNGSVSEDEHRANLRYAANSYIEDGLMLSCKKEDVTLQKVTFGEEEYGGYDVDGFITVSRMKRDVILDYGYFTMTVQVGRDVPVFDNGVLIENMASMDFDEKNVEVTNEWVPDVNSWILKATVKIPIGDQFLYGEIQRNLGFE